MHWQHPYHHRHTTADGDRKPYDVIIELWGEPPLCVGVWVCGCVGVWVCGCVGMWVGVWVCGCVGVWVCGCMCVCVYV